MRGVKERNGDATAGLRSNRFPRANLFEIGQAWRLTDKRWKREHCIMAVGTLSSGGVCVLELITIVTHITMTRLSLVFNSSSSLEHVSMENGQNLVEETRTIPSVWMSSRHHLPQFKGSLSNSLHHRSHMNKRKERLKTI